jgi:sarcosine oxidase
MLDAIVVGLGGFGSAALYHLALRGARVLGLESFHAAHAWGSSHGQTRIIRKAYFEHPNYVPLLHAAYALWRALEQETGRTLLVQAGLVLSGRPESESIAGTLRSAREHNLAVELLSPADARRRFDGFVFPDDFQTIFEQQAGFLEVESCVQSHLDRARALGASMGFGEPVVSWRAVAGGVEVVTSQNCYQAGRLVVTAGPWASQILAELLAAQLQVVRKPVFWFPAGRNLSLSAGTPTFFFETAFGQFYGFPRIDGNCLKVAEHTRGDVADPGSVDRALHPEDLAAVARFLRVHLPGVRPIPAAHSVCLYTKTPDQHFLIDWHPRHRQVVFGAGFSGHGFKFTTVLGQALAEMALNGRTALPVQFLSLSRLMA